MAADDGGYLGLRVPAAVWGRYHLTTGGTETIGLFVRRKIPDILKEFAAEYYRQNPD